MQWENASKCITSVCKWGVNGARLICYCVVNIFITYLRKYKNLETIFSSSGALL